MSWFKTKKEKEKELSYKERIWLDNLLRKKIATEIEGELKDYEISMCRSILSKIEFKD